jgi:hypothetical protein
MNRDTLISAITMGLKRAAARRAPIAETVADTIELALQLERSMGRASAPTRIDGGSTERDQAEGLPPNPEAILESVEDDHYEDPSEAPPAPDPDLSPEPPLIVLANERTALTSPAPLRVKKLYAGNKLRVGLQQLVDWANTTFPRKIQVLPKGMEHEIELELQVRPFPAQGNRRSFELDSMIKVVYMNPRIAPGVKSPGISSDVIDATEVGVPVSVQSAQEGFPAMGPILDKVKAQAVEMWKVRPQQITGRVENVPELRAQFASALNKHAKGKRSPDSITLIDDDDTSLFRSDSM